MKPDSVINAENGAISDGRLRFEADFSRLAHRIRPDRVNSEMLVKAVRIKSVPPEATEVIDATAGLGEDAFILAAAGFHVTMYERDAVIADALEAALEKAIISPELSAIAERLTLIKGDSKDALCALEKPPGVIYLDPMFPESKKSALIKKKFQLLRRLESPCEDEEELLEAALRAGAKKTVIKRPLKGPYLAGKKPDYSISGKAIRYDCIVNHRFSEVKNAEFAQ